MKNINRILSWLFLSASSITVSAQTGIGTLTPHSSAQLDVVSNNKGLLAPRMTTAQRTSINNPADGLLVYDTSTHSFWYYKTGTGWSNLQSAPFSLPFLAIENNNNHLFTILNSGMGTPIVAASYTNTYDATAIQGILDNASPGYLSSGVSGVHRGTGVNGFGVHGEHWGGGSGVYGRAATGVGVMGYSAKGTGVSGYSDSTYGVQAGSLWGIGLFASSTDSFAIRAVTNKKKPTVRIENNYTGTTGNTYTTGLYASQADSGYGVIATSNAGVGLLGSATYGKGVIGTSSLRTGTSGYSYSGSGMEAESVYGIGIKANSYDSSAARFENTNTSNTAATLDVTTVAASGYASRFKINNSSSNSVVVSAETNGDGTALYGKSSGGVAVRGISTDSFGVIGISSFMNGVYAYSDYNIGLVAMSGSGSAARFRITDPTNPSPVFLVEEVGTSNLAIFRSGSSSSTIANVARISNNGTGYFNGGTQSSGADIAEAFDVVNEISEYEPGDVLVISQDHDRTVEKSNDAYSSLVIGVYATKPGVLLTEEDIETDISDKVPMGVVGVIPTKVCTDGGVIKRGDMLVTSSRKGVAMKADPNKIKTGQIIGKALQNYDGDGVGKINVFVNVK